MEETSLEVLRFSLPAELTHMLFSGFLSLEARRGIPHGRRPILR